MSVAEKAIASDADALQLSYSKPAKEWTEALPIGNGRFGAMVFGGTDGERIQFNDDTLFSGEPHDYAHPGASQHLAELRQLLFDGKQEEAHRLGNRVFMSRSARGTIRQEAYQPFGELLLEFPSHTNVADYRRELNIDEAVTSVRYRAGDVRFEREAFASHPDDLIAVRMLADQPGQLTFTVELASPHEQISVDAQPDQIVLAGVVDRGKTRFQSQLLIRLEGPNATSSVEGKKISVKSADAVTLLLVGASSFVNFRDIDGDPAARNKETLERISSKSYGELRKAHVDDYQSLFRRVTLDLGTSEAVNQPTDERIKNFANQNDSQLVTLYFQFGRYLLIASSRPGSQPANLQGIWNESKTPPWESKWTININAEMNYWPTELTNLSECHEPLFSAIEDLSQSGANVAREHYNARGWVAHHNFDLWRGAAPINSSDHGIWPMGGAWLCEHLWYRYAFTGDEEFLRDRAYPLMKGAALFFTDYLMEDPRNSEHWLISGPSNSPEQGGLVMGPTMDHQIVRSLLAHVIEASEILDVDADLRSKLKDMRSRIAPNQIGRNGQLQEWLEDVDDPNNRHRHVSHLWALHPGDEITPRTTPELAAACRETLAQRGDGGTGWSKAWKINFWARLGDGEHAYRLLSEAITGNTYPNMFDAHPPFQIDGNFGGTSGIAEMLVQSHVRDPNGNYEIELLPALPSAWPNGQVTGLRARGGFEVDITWLDGKMASAALRSLDGKQVTLRYGEQTRRLETTKGEAYRLGPALADQ